MVKRLIVVDILLISIVLLIIGAVKLINRVREYVEGEEVYSELEEYVTLYSQQPGEDDTACQTDTGVNESDMLSVDFAALSQINQDIVGWLCCEGTAINYPVVQGSDNEYYLDHLFDGSENANGCLFLDSRVEPFFSSCHSIIYGHHMQSGAMFAALDNYKRQSYYDAYPTMLLITPDETYEIQLFAAYVTAPSEDAWNVSFSNDEEFQRWLDDAKARSTFSSDIEPTPEDRILTLSTCSYEFSDSRLVVLGEIKEIEMG